MPIMINVMSGAGDISLVTVFSGNKEEEHQLRVRRGVEDLLVILRLSSMTAL